MHENVLAQYRYYLRSELTSDLSQDMQDDHREDKTNGQKENNQRVDSQALCLVSEQLQHRRRRSTSTSSSGRQWLLVGLFGLFISNVLSLSSRSQTAWGNSRRLDVSIRSRTWIKFFISCGSVGHTIMELVICKYVFAGFST